MAFHRNLPERPLPASVASRTRILDAIKPYVDAGERIDVKAVTKHAGIRGPWLSKALSGLVEDGTLRRVGTSTFAWADAKARKPTHTINAYPDIPLSRLMGRR